MSDQTLDSLDRLSDDFDRLDRHAPEMQATIIIQMGKLAAHCFQGPGGRAAGARLSALVEQAGLLAMAVFRGEAAKGHWQFFLRSPFDPSHVIDTPWECWLFYLLRTYRTHDCCHILGAGGAKCRVSFGLGDEQRDCYILGEDGGKYLAPFNPDEGGPNGLVPFPGNGEEISIHIDNFAQVCVTALAYLKARLLFLAGVGREQKNKRPRKAIEDLTPPPPPRLTVDLARRTITLDGQTYEVGSENALRWVKVLAEHPGEWISGPTLKQYDVELDGSRPDRLKKHLSDAILALIDSGTGKGSRVLLA